MKTGRFRVSDLRLVAKAPPPDIPPLGVGDRCRLNSGGPAMIIVDVTSGCVVAAYRSGEQVEEVTLCRECVRRITGER